mmetsp:Transcript_9686/g.16251  ORF Transcript_9686/g.16251 Transcript_9686/m.16251 type:complete len:307 (+) Transcript_9686:609-1529(+)
MRSLLFLGLLHDDVAPNICGHDHHRVLEIHSAALRICQTPILQNLQHHVEHVRVGLLDLVEQQHAVRPLAHHLRELAALVVAHIAWGGPDQLRHGMTLHVLGHVESDHGVLSAEILCCQGLGQLCLAHACGPQEEEAGNRPVGVLHANACAAQCACNATDGRLLPNHLLMQALLQMQQRRALIAGDLLHRDASPPRHDARNVLCRDNHVAVTGLGSHWANRFVARHSLELVLELLNLATHDRKLLEFMGVQVVSLHLLQCAQLLLQLLHLRGRCVAPGRRQALTRTGLVQQINGFVRKEAVVDVLR